MLVTTSEMTQNIRDKRDGHKRHTLWPEGQELSAPVSSRFICIYPSGQNSRLYDQTCSVQRICTNVIVQQKGVKFRPTAESVQSPYCKKGMFPYLQGTINLKAVSVSLAEIPVCKQHISTFPIMAALTLHPGQ